MNVMRFSSWCTTVDLLANLAYVVICDHQTCNLIICQSEFSIQRRSIGKMNMIAVSTFGSKQRATAKIWSGGTPLTSRGRNDIHCFSIPGAEELDWASQSGKTTHQARLTAILRIFLKISVNFHLWKPGKFKIISKILWRKRRKAVVMKILERDLHHHALASRDRSNLETKNIHTDHHSWTNLSERPC